MSLVSSRAEERITSTVAHLFTISPCPVLALSTGVGVEFIHRNNLPLLAAYCCPLPCIVRNLFVENLKYNEPAPLPVSPNVHDLPL
jgi:hypothetical protein